LRNSRVEDGHRSCLVLGIVQLVPHSSWFHHDEWVLSEAGRWFGFDFDHTTGSREVVVVAAPLISFGGCREAALDGVLVDVVHGVGAGVLSTDVAVEVADLPELLPIALYFSRRRLLEGFEELSQEDGRWLVDQQVDMLGHEHVGIDAGTVTGSGLFEDGFDGGFGVGIVEVGKTVVTTEGDEVERFGLLVPLETVRHMFIVSCPVAAPETHSSR
jgi:hypothetical protein